MLEQATLIAGAASRPTPSEALRHPFTTDRLLDKDQVAKVLCPGRNEQPAEVGAAPPAAADIEQLDEVARKQHDDLMRSVEEAAKKSRKTPEIEPKS